MKRVLILGALAGFLAAGLFAQANSSNTTPAIPATATQASDVKPYGFQLGTISGFANFSAAHISDVSGLHPGIEGGLEVGLHKYLGVFAQGGWTGVGASESVCSFSYCASASAHANYYGVGGGLEVVGTNRSRFVPYGKIGFGYMTARANASATVVGVGSGYATVTANSPTVIFGGGVKTYLSHRWGIDAGITGYHATGTNVTGTVIAPTVGVFFQSK